MNCTIYQSELHHHPEATVQGVLDDPSAEAAGFMIHLIECTGCQQALDAAVAAHPRLAAVLNTSGSELDLALWSRAQDADDATVDDVGVDDATDDEWRPLLERAAARVHRRVGPWLSRPLLHLGRRVVVHGLDGLRALAEGTAAAADRIQRSIAELLVRVMPPRPIATYGHYGKARPKAIPEPTAAWVMGGREPRAIEFTALEPFRFRPSPGGTMLTGTQRFPAAPDIDLGQYECHVVLGADMVTSARLVWKPDHKCFLASHLVVLEGPRQVPFEVPLALCQVYLLPAVGA